MGFPRPGLFTLKSITVNGKAYNAKSVQTYPHGKAVSLRGKTLPNAKVKLYIFSTPREAVVTADGNGDWTYSIADLESGSHRVEAEVTDPTTSKTLPRTVLATFAVATPDASTVSKSVNPIVYAALAVAVIALTGASIWYIKKNRTNIFSKRK